MGSGGTGGAGPGTGGGSYAGGSGWGPTMGGGSGYSGGNLGGLGTAGTMSGGAGGAGMDGYGGGGMAGLSGSGWGGPGGSAGRNLQYNQASGGSYGSPGYNTATAARDASGGIHYGNYGGYYPGVGTITPQQAYNMQQQGVAFTPGVGYASPPTPQSNPAPAPARPIGGTTSPGMPGGMSPGGFAVNSGGFRSPSGPTTVGGGSIGYGGNLGSMVGGTGGSMTTGGAQGGGLNRTGTSAGRF